MSSAEKLACDTSVLFPALAPWHPDHTRIRPELARVAAVPAHCLAETYANLTGGRASQRVAPAAAATALQRLGLPVIAPGAATVEATINALGENGLSGGSVYDAIIAATAAEHDMTLLTRDGRARRSYDAVGASYLIVE
ncbi:PIN domain-containing protein [Salana multivorans]